MIEDFVSFLLDLPDIGIFAQGVLIGMEFVLEAPPPGHFD